ncbi:prepilin-type N-terminal cleavage/methylation domain-containing protein [Paenisporosarcina sp. TG20]|uniref:prepilin-type N-terminal cleavage/methylation domain-containing protein n=1 Tax=Paenisporosarcina sp. TG20 TaxID=1211706 RepID=UPI0002D2FFD5|nr:prepilin-type N-terminal cleavage/methylation domain-containing protein [Paenisporosarcina sp. TG20]
MRKFIQNKLKDQKGLTLIELLAVIVILAIIAAIAIPAIGNIITNSKINALKADGQNMLASANLYFTENQVANGVSVNLEVIQDAGFIEDAGKINTDATTPFDILGSVTYNSTGLTITATSSDGGKSVEFVAATNNDIANAGTATTTTGKVIITR